MQVFYHKEDLPDLEGTYACIEKLEKFYRQENVGFEYIVCIGSFTIKVIFRLYDI